jgi:very-short-patch-repair endonuclease
MSGSALAVNKFVEIPLNPPFFLSRDHFVGKGGVLSMQWLAFIFSRKYIPFRENKKGEKMKIYYNPKLKEKARYLRNNSTLSEILLWNELKRRKLLGYQFFRQKPIGNYIVDFFSYTLRLVIEVDGESHDESAFEYDQMRQEYLESIGLTVLRFDDLKVKREMRNVLRVIEEWISENYGES